MACSHRLAILRAGVLHGGAAGFVDHHLRNEGLNRALNRAIVLEIAFVDNHRPAAPSGRRDR
jgi:hypothetical protein